MEECYILWLWDIFFSYLYKRTRKLTASFSANNHLMIMRKGSLRKQQSKKQQNTCIPLREEPRKGQINGVSNESQTILLPDVGLCEI